MPAGAHGTPALESHALAEKAVPAGMPDLDRLSPRGSRVTCGNVQRPRNGSQTTVRLPDELADAAEVVARVKGTSVNVLIIESLAAEVERVRHDKDSVPRAKPRLERDKELLDRSPGDEFRVRP